MLILHGDQDAVVPVHLGRKLHSIAAAAAVTGTAGRPQFKVEIVTFENADHDWIVREKEVLFNALRAFLGP